MRSTYLTGAAAGSAACLRGEGGDPYDLGYESLEVRREAGIAPTEPEDEYLLGFSDGLQGFILVSPDGLCLAEDEARKVRTYEKHTQYYQNLLWIVTIFLLVINPLIDQVYLRSGYLTLFH